MLIVASENSPPSKQTMIWSRERQWLGGAACMISWLFILWYIEITIQSQFVDSKIHHDDDFPPGMFSRVHPGSWVSRMWRFPGHTSVIIFSQWLSALFRLRSFLLLSTTWILMCLLFHHHDHFICSLCQIMFNERMNDHHSPNDKRANTMEYNDFSWWRQWMGQVASHHLLLSTSSLEVTDGSFFPHHSFFCSASP